MISFLICAAVVVVGLNLAKKLKPAAATTPAPPVTPAPASTLTSLAGQALAGVENLVNQVPDEVLSLEYARRVKEKADLIKTQQVLKNLHDHMLAQFTPVASVLPAEVTAHPAAQLAAAPTPPAAAVPNP